MFLQRKLLLSFLHALKYNTPVWLNSRSVVWQLLPGPNSSTSGLQKWFHAFHCSRSYSLSCASTFLRVTTGFTVCAPWKGFLLPSSEMPLLWERRDLVAPCGLGYLPRPVIWRPQPYQARDPRTLHVLWETGFPGLVPYILPFHVDVF